MKTCARAYGVTTMIARTVTDGRDGHSLFVAHADLLTAAVRAIHATLDGARWAVWRWYQVGRTRRQISNLPDHLLKDIGLSRTTLVGATMRRVHEEEAIRRGARW
jgi:uncharacterized protein YjiS (DUF1127 family)